MHVTEKQLFDLLDQLNIRHSTVEHPALFTVEQGRDYHHLIPGLHCKNLFLCDKKGELFLALMPCDKRASISTLQKRVGCDRLSFGKPELLMEVLGMPVGGVNPFSLMNDKEKRVTVIIDTDLLVAETVNFHPLRNTASTTLSSKDLKLFIEHLGYTPLVLDCGNG